MTSVPSPNKQKLKNQAIKVTTLELYGRNDLGGIVNFVTCHFHPSLIFAIKAEIQHNPPYSRLNLSALQTCLEYKKKWSTSKKSTCQKVNLNIKRPKGCG